VQSWRRPATIHLTLAREQAVGDKSPKSTSKSQKQKDQQKEQQKAKPGPKK
jgi:hypothetical protein